MHDGGVSPGNDRWLTWGAALVLAGGYAIFAPVWHPRVAPRLYDCARALELWMLSALALLALIPPVRVAVAQAWMRLSLPPRIALGMWIAGGAASALVSVAPAMGFQQIASLMLLAWMALVIAAAVRALGLPAERLLMMAISTGATLVVFRFWVDYVQSVSAGIDFSWVSPFLDFANIRFFGQYQAYALLPAALPLLVLNLTWAWRTCAGFVAAGFWALQWIAGARAVWAGLAVALVAVALCMARGRVKWLAVQVGLVLAGGLLYLGFDGYMLSAPNATPLPTHLSIAERGGESSAIRVTLARAAVGLVAEHPLAGTGPGQFGLHYSLTDAAHPHNAPLQLLAEYGLIAGSAGIAVGVMLALFCLRTLWRRSRQGVDMTTATLAAAIVMGLSDALFSGNLIMPHSQVLLALLAGWLMGRAADSPSAQMPDSPAVRTALGGLAVLAACVTLVLMTAYLDVIRDMAAPPDMRVPSFWQYGRFDAW